MPWIESHTNISRHRKLKKLARVLNISLSEIIGHLHLLWHNVLELAEDGNITKWSKEDIAEYAGYTGDPNKFYKALVNEGDGFIDENGDLRLMHKWFEYAGRYLTAKYRSNNPERLQEIKSLYGLTMVIPKSDFSQPTNITNITNITNMQYKDQINRVLFAFLDLKNYPKEPQDLTYYYRRFTNTIKQLLTLAKGNADDVIEAIRWIGGHCDKKGLTWTLETALKWYPEFVAKGAKSDALKRLEKLIEEKEEQRSELCKQTKS